MATDQNIKNKTLAWETVTAYGRYLVDWHVSPRKSLFLQFCISFRKPLLGNLFLIDRIFFGGLDLKIFNIANHENWKLLEVETVKTSASSLTVSATIFPDIITRFAVYCFNQHCRISLSEKSKKEKSIDFRVRTKW